MRHSGSTVNTALHAGITDELCVFRAGGFYLEPVLAERNSLRASDTMNRSVLISCVLYLFNLFRFKDLCIREDTSGPSLRDFLEYCAFVFFTRFYLKNAPKSETFTDVQTLVKLCLMNYVTVQPRSPGFQSLSS